MRVLHLNKTAVGAAWAVLQARELIRARIDVHVAMPSGPMVAAFEREGATVHPMATCLPTLARGAQPLRAIRGLVNELRPDLIHSHFVATTLGMRMALRGIDIPRVFQVPGPLHLESVVPRTADIRSANTRDYWIASCEWTRRKYIACGVPASRVFLSYYGTDVNKIAPTGRSMRLRRELGIGPETPLVGMISYVYRPKYVLGQFRGVKGHEDFIEAVSRCRRTMPELRAVVIGGAWAGADAYERRLRALAARTCGDAISFLGTRSDVHDLYEDLDVAVHPSLSENVGGAVESLLHQVPTIATNVGGFPDLVRPGETGILTPPRDPERLAEAMLSVFRHSVQAREMAARGRALAHHLFDVRRTAGDVVQIYREILDQAGTGQRTKVA